MGLFGCRDCRESPAGICERCNTKVAEDMAEALRKELEQIRKDQANANGGRR